jgi:hypothetical protein
MLIYQFVLALLVWGVCEAKVNVTIGFLSAYNSSSESSFSVADTICLQTALDDASDAGLLTDIDVR